MDIFMSFFRYFILTPKKCFIRPLSLYFTFWQMIDLSRYYCIYFQNSFLFVIFINFYLNHCNNNFPKFLEHPRTNHLLALDVSIPETKSLSRITNYFSLVFLVSLTVRSPANIKRQWRTKKWPVRNAFN